MLDIDLGILGAPSDEYRRYNEAIRKEFGFVSDEGFRRGRSSLLQTILEQQIHRTEHFRPLEERARANIEAELSSLNP